MSIDTELGPMCKYVHFYGPAEIGEIITEESNNGKIDIING